MFVFHTGTSGTDQEENSSESPEERERSLGAERGGGVLKGEKEQLQRAGKGWKILL